MTDYLIKLLPLTPYFFGGENTFGEDSTNYFVRSNYLPQQTTLLGFLRYELLLQNDLLGSDPGAYGSPWKSLIGNESFSILDSDEVPDFGAIVKLSPLFLTNGSEHFLPAPFNRVMYEKDGKEELVSLVLDFDHEGESLTTHFRTKLPLLTVKGERYKAKWEIKPVWISADGRTMRQWEYEQFFKEGCGYDNGFFIQEQQTGIFKKKRKSKMEKDEGDFYKKISYKLADNFQFAFILTLDLPEGTQFGPRVVTMGGERSVFQMSMSPSTGTFEDIFPASLFTEDAGHQPALVLTSDAFATEDITAYCDYSISDTVPFRNIRSKTINKGDYTRINGGALQKSESLTYLLKRGSIFFGRDLQDVKAALDKPAFKVIGYNQFVEI